MAVEIAASPIRPVALGRSAAWNLFGLSTPVLLAILCIPVLIRNLGVERFGLLGVLWTVVGYAGLFDLGLSRTLNHEVSRRLGYAHSGAVRQSVKTGVTTLAVVGGVFGSLCIAFAGALASAVKVSPSIHGELVSSLRLLGFAIPIAVVNSGLTGTLEALGRFGQSNACRIAIALVTFGGSALMSLTSTSLMVAAGTLLAARIVALGLASLFVRRNLRQFDPSGHVSPREMWEFLCAGRWLMAGNLLSPALAYGDRLVVTFVVPAALLAYYVTPYEMVTKVLIASSAVSNALFPAISRHTGNAVVLRPLILRSARMVLLAISPLVVIGILGAKPALGIWVNPEFADKSFRIAQILCLGVLCNALGAVAFSALQGMGHARAIVRIHVIEFPLYLTALTVAAHEAGIFGVALTWTGRMFIDATVLWAATWNLAPFTSRWTSGTRR